MRSDSQLTRTPGGERRASTAEPEAARRDLATLARGGALNVVGILANAVLGFAFSVVVARALGADGAGLVFVAVAAFTILQTVAQLGADIGMIRTISRDVALGEARLARPVVRIGLVPVLTVGAAVGVALFVLAPQVAGVISHDDDGDAVTYLRLLAPFVPISAGSAVLLAATRGLGAMLPFVAVERIGRAALRVAFALAVVALGLGGTALLLVWAIPFAIGFAVGAIWLRYLLSRAEHASPGSAPLPPLRAVAGDFWRFSAYRGVAALFSISVIWLDVVLLGALASAREAGIYSAASRIVTAGSFGLQAVLIVMGPQISGLLARGDRKRTQALFEVSTSWLTGLSFPYYVTAALFAPLLLSVFGSDFRSGATALVILSLAMLLDMVTGPVTTVLLMAGKSSWNLINVLATLAVNVALNVLLIPPLGMTGAAIAWAVSIVVQNALPLIQIWRHLGLQPFSQPLIAAVVGPALCYGGVGLALIAVMGTTVTALAIFLVCSNALYVAFLARFRAPLRLDALWDALSARWRRGPARQSAADL